MLKNKINAVWGTFVMVNNLCVAFQSVSTISLFIDSLFSPFTISLGSLPQFDKLFLSSFGLFCHLASAMMELYSVTLESVKVRKQINRSNIRSSWVNNPITLLPCLFFFLPSFSHPQRVVRVDSVLSLCALCLPAAQPLTSRSYHWQQNGFISEAFPSLFGPGFWSSSL